MFKASFRFGSGLLATCALLCGVTATAQQEPGLIGSWQAKDGELVIRVTFNPDGTGTLDGTPIKYSVKGAQLIVNEEGTINSYTFKLTGDVMVVSGGDLDSPMTFHRQGSGEGVGGRKSQPAVAPAAETKPKERGACRPLAKQSGNRADQRRGHACTRRKDLSL